MTGDDGLFFRQLGPDDLPGLHALVSDWAVVRQLGSWPWPPDLAFTRTRCRPYDGDGFVWGIFDAGRLIGTVAVTQGVLGYCLEIAQAGQGIATRVATRALTDAFADPGLTQVVADVWIDNSASRRVLTKLGFIETGSATEMSKARGVPTGSLQYTLTRAAWDGLRSGAQSTIGANKPIGPAP